MRSRSHEPARRDGPQSAVTAVLSAAAAALQGRAVRHDCRQHRRPEPDGDVRRERERDTLKTNYETIDAYLASLELHAVVHRAPDTELGRVAQLVSKTNQFNLTTRRHTEAQIRELANSPAAGVFTMSARDWFGDLGLIAVLIARLEGQTAVVDSLLMSCRALGRKLELAFVDTCFAALERDWNIGTFEAEFLPTKKNAQVERFWDDSAFAPVSAGPEGKRSRSRRPPARPTIFLSSRYQSNEQRR